MSSSTLLIKAFNTHFFQFINEIADVLPECEEIELSKTYLETVKSANPTLLVKIWYQFIYEPYSTEIEKGNMNFFFEKDYAHDVKQMPQSEKILDFVDKVIRKSLKQLDDNNLDKCKEHILLLSRISNKYKEMKL